MAGLKPHLPTAAEVWAEPVVHVYKQSGQSPWFSNNTNNVVHKQSGQSPWFSNNTNNLGRARSSQTIWAEPVVHKHYKMDAWLGFTCTFCIISFVIGFSIGRLCTHSCVFVLHTEHMDALTHR